METISSEFAAAAEKVGSSVVAVHARRWMPTSGYGSGSHIELELSPEGSGNGHALETIEDVGSCGNRDAGEKGGVNRSLFSQSPFSPVHFGGSHLGIRALLAHFYAGPAVLLCGAD